MEGKVQAVKLNKMIDECEKIFWIACFACSYR